jgi:hypothetical protein
VCASDSVPGGTQYRQLAHVDAYDAILNADYAFIGYQETDNGGVGRVRIKASQTARAVFEPDATCSHEPSAAIRGKPWFQWGYRFDPGSGDQRCIRFRAHAKHGRPQDIEMFVRLRKFDGSADETKSVRFDRPE